MPKRTVGLPKAVEVDFDSKEPELAPKKCLICGRKYNLVFEKNGFIFYRHQGMKREHEFSQIKEK
jgi:hypothetical protein